MNKTKYDQARLVNTIESTIQKTYTFKYNT